jgi:MFS family permease
MAIAMGWRKPDNVAGSSAPAIMIGFFVASGGFLFGYDTGSIGGILAMDTFKEHFADRQKDGKPTIYPDQVAIIVSILSAGTVVGSLLSAPAGDRWGRRLSLLGSIALFCIGVILQVCSSNIPILLLGRCVFRLFLKRVLWRSYSPSSLGSGPASALDPCPFSCHYTNRRWPPSG